VIVFLAEIGEGPRGDAIGVVAVGEDAAWVAAPKPPVDMVLSKDPGLVKKEYPILSQGSA
jgi:hypothetical protein